MSDHASLQRQSALDEGQSSSDVIECAAEVTLTKRAFLSKVKVQRVPGLSVRDESGLCRWNLAANSAVTGDPTVFWTGPAERLLISITKDPATLLDSIAAEADSHSVVATDVSDALCVLRGSGPGMRAMLSRCTSIDPDELDSAGRCCAQTAILKSPVLLHRVRDPDAVDFYFDRALARTMRDWLIHCAGGVRQTTRNPSQTLE